MTDDTLTTTQAATLLGIKPASVRYRCEHGLFPRAINHGGRIWMIPRADVLAASRLGRLRPGPKPTHRPPPSEDTS